MPQLTYPLSSDGLTYQVLIGLNPPDTDAMVRAGQPIPPSVPVRALLDTGSDRTAAAPHVFQQLGLVPFIHGTAQTAGGSFQVDLDRVKLTIPGPSGSSPVLTLPDLLVSELTTPLPNVDALIGLDVLGDCLLILNGPGQQFTLWF